MITATMAITIGLTFYHPKFEGETLACGGTYTKNRSVWMAAPIEWNQDGYVGCWDMGYVVFANGHTLKAPILDFGCHLHYPAYDSGLPYGADFPRINGLEKVPTGTGTLAIKRKNGEWWDKPSLVAWGTEWCNGPLTVREDQCVLSNAEICWH